MRTFTRRLILASTLTTLLSGVTLNTIAQSFKVALPPGYNRIIQAEGLGGVEGSQYLNDEWTLGNITMNDTMSIGPIKLRFNAYKGEMHFLDNNIEYSIGAPEKITNIIMGGRKFIYASYLDKDVTKNNFFEVLAEGKTELLILYYIERIPANYNPTMDTGEKNDRLRLAEKIYIEIGDNIIEHDRKGKKLIAALGDKSSQVIKLVEEEDLSFKKKEDLIKIINFVNSVN